MTRSTRGARSKAANAGDATSDVYSEMLAEAVSSSPTRKSDDGATVKRRRVAGRLITQSVDGKASQAHEQNTSKGNQDVIDDLFEDPKPTPQHIEQTETEESEDSDQYFEDVVLDSSIKHEIDLGHEAEGEEELHLVLGEGNQKAARSAQVRRKPITSAEKKLRLEIHKMHLCCLLAHAHLRNHWCNDESVHSICRSRLTKKTISYLNPNESTSQFQRSRSFMDGLKQASDAFGADFRITARGMSKPVWADSPETLALLQPPEDIDLPIQKSDFVAAAGKFEASRDVGAQVFCAMLRAAGVDARLVCSLLPLPFQPAIKIAAGNIGHIGADTRSKLGQVKRSASPEVSSSKVSISPKGYRKPVRESKYPVYWVEAFNEAVQKWVPVDPLVTKTISKPSKMEPPAGDSQNNMGYVIAFEDDGSARDVTRRYAKAYNAKTRRERVEITKDGDRWWRRVMRLYRGSHEMDRDQVEDAELTAKEAAEPMPRNVQDFKDHPYYALERHLKRHEVIHPKREVGKLGVGRPGSTSGLESIYRRRDVHQLKSADKWYRIGREIKHGEQPLKRIAGRRTQESSLDPADMDTAEDDNAGTALYAPHQTLLYVAPPVNDGRIPKNVYGNLDVYVPSMVPPGGIHLSHPDTARAARILGIDYADAVTGFSFTGRHGTAVVHGAVVAAEYQQAVEEVIQTFEDERAQAEEEQRILAALKMWKRFLAGLRIRERIEGYDIEGQRDIRTKYEMEEEDKDEDEDEDEGGGFLPDQEAKETAQPTASAMPTRHSSSMLMDDETGGFSTAEEERQEEEKTLPASERCVKSIHDDDDDGRGFLLDHDDQDAKEGIGKIDRDGDENRECTGKEQDPGPIPAERNSQEILDQGGGFLTEENDIGDEAPSKNDSVDFSNPESGIVGNRSSIDLRDTSQSNENSKEISLKLPVDELEEARMLQQLHESHGSEHFGTRNEVVTTPIPMDLADSPSKQKLTAGSERDSTAQPRQTHPNHESVVGRQNSEPDSSEDEKGSLLSHDPDDEDADPEWLA